MTGNHDRDSALRAISLGAYDFYQKPVDTDVLRLIVQRAFHISALEEQIRTLRESQLDTPFQGLIATDDAMRKVCRMIDKVAPTDVSVLVLGESGTGKELVARAVHTTSNRKAGRFVAINCAAIPEQLLESELFGHEKGAFTGAAKQTIGKIETADGGTLFLDEIGDMPLSLQAKLLRFLQDRKIERVGGRQEISVDVRIVCATNRDLQALISEQRFRQDLYFRIGEVTIDDSAAARSARGCDRAGARDDSQVRRSARSRTARLYGGCTGVARRLLLARQRPRAGEQGEVRAHHERWADDHCG